MTDVVIRSSSDQGELAGKLDSALSSAGFDVWRGDGSEDDFWYSDDVLERIASAKAAIVLWSEKSAASALVRAEANAARQQKKLIQVSADGEAPPPPFGEAPLAALSGWRGDPGHPELRKIVAALKTLSTPGPAEPSPDRFALAAAPPASRGRTLKLIALTSLAAAAGWIGGTHYGARQDGGTAAQTMANAGWMAPARAQAAARERNAEAGKRFAASSAAAKLETAARARPAAPAAEPAPESAAAPKPAPRTAEAVPEPKPEAPRAGRATAREKADKPVAKTSNGRNRAAKASRAKPARPRIKYAHSENMRLFCQNAGRTTAECRRFRRNAPRIARQDNYRGGP